MTAATVLKRDVLRKVGTDPPSTAPAVFSATEMIVTAAKKLVEKAEMIVSALEKSISVVEMIVCKTDRIASYI